MSRSIIGFLYLLLGKPYLNRNLTTFVFHEIHDAPHLHSRDTRTFSDLRVFENQIKWIKSSFTIIDLQKNTDPKLKEGCIVSFDDGYAGILHNALPILEKYQIPAICFINMATMQGGINSSALAMYTAKRKHEKVDWNNSNPQFLKEALGSLKYEELQEVKEYQGPFMNVSELRLLSQNPLITVGNHLYNHWLMDDLSLVELDIEIAKNEKELQKYKSYRNYFATPHGVASERTLNQLLENKYKTVFSGKKILQEGQLNVYPRIDLNIRIANKYQFFGAIAISKIWVKYYSIFSKKKGRYSKH